MPPRGGTKERTHKLMDADEMTLKLVQDAPRRSMQRLVLPLRVLVACEYSGTVRDAFAARGHDAMSCDILPTDKPGKHYQGDVRELGYAER